MRCACQTGTRFLRSWTRISWWAGRLPNPRDATGQQRVGKLGELLAVLAIAICGDLRAQTFARAIRAVAARFERGARRSTDEGEQRETGAHRGSECPHEAALVLLAQLACRGRALVPGAGRGET